MPQIPVYSHGSVAAYAEVDAEDAGRVAAHRWHLHATRSGGTPYVVRYEHVGERPTRKTLTIYLHREICGLSFGDPLQADHRDLNNLNNCRDNIRRCTNEENMKNRPRYRSRQGGVYLDRRCGRWRAYAKRKYLGTFGTSEEAHARVNRWWQENAG